MAASTGIYMAALFVWSDVEQSQTLVASLIMTSATLFTVLSALYSEVYRRPLHPTFLSAQSLFDLLLVTAIVHITGAGESQFTALYILVIASASLLLTTRLSLLVAALGCVLYFGDALISADDAATATLWMQLSVFGVVALTSGYIGAKLREAGLGSEQLAAELAKARLQASDILKHIRSGIITIDARGILRFANPTAESLLDMPLDAHIGEPIVARIEAVAPGLAKALQRAMVGGQRTVRTEDRVTTATRTFPIGLTTTQRDEARPGDPPDQATTTAIFQDISDQKRLDVLHKRAERLEAVAELSASLAHEIKNPLASIRSAVEQLGRSPTATPDEVVLSTLIVRESDRLSRLLSEFLDFARARVSRITKVNLAAVARGAAELATAHPDRSPGMTVDVHLPEEFIIEADEDLLHRAIFNLVLNAIQASPDTGVISVELENVNTDHTTGGPSFDLGAVALRVSDQGDGVSDDIRDRLFDPFFTTKPGGSGLGLSVVHRAIEAHGGFVFFDSDTRGSRVTVLLPVSHSEIGVPA